MSRACCVPGCKSNYRSTLKTQPRRSAFAFPKDEELRKKWIQAIPRKHWAPNKNSVVCEEHFSPSEILTEDFIIDERGEKIVLRELRKPSIEGAVPHIFPTLPSYLSTPRPSTSIRADPEERRKIAKKREDEQIQDILAKDIIHSYSDFRSGVHEKVSGCWTVSVKSHETHLYIVDGDGQSPHGLSVHASVIVNLNLEVSVYVKGCRRSHHQLGDVLSKNNILNRWSQLEALLQISLSSIVDSDLDFMFFVSLAITCLSRALSVASESLQNRATLLNFIIEQLQLKSVLDSGYLQVVDLDESVRVYICGYVAKSLHSKFKCTLCQNLYESIDRASVSDKYFKELQRGGLHVPADKIMFIYYHMLAILQFILSNREFDKAYLEGGSHKYVLVELTLSSINRDATFIDMKNTCDKCKVPYQTIYLSACNILANILLNNYTKLKTDTDLVSSLRRSKYSTLQSM